MTRILPVAALAVFLAACGSSRPVPGDLERFQSLRPELGTVTSASDSASTDMNALRSRMAAGDVAGTKAAAGHLRWDAERLQAAAGRAAAPIRSLARHEGNRVRRTYFTLVLDALSDEWREGRALTDLSVLAWWDPDITVGRHAVRLKVLAAQARREATLSVQQTRAADRWRASHSSVFRYIAVRDSVSG